MYHEKLELSEDQIEDYKNQTAKSHFRSNFNFLKSHNGLRKNKLHLLIAPTHAGKSTFVRSVICDLVFRNSDKKILLWLTEETIDEFKQEFSKTVPSHDVLKNITIYSEQSCNQKENEINKYISELTEYYNFDIVVKDNITTSKLYQGKSVRDQDIMGNYYKQITKKSAVFLIAHTNTSDFKNRFLNETDIRGSKSIVNIAQFLYILQPISIGNQLIQFINIAKHRGFTLKNKFFRLNYSTELSAFENDMAIDFDIIKEVFKRRNKLEGGK